MDIGFRREERKTIQKIIAVVVTLILLGVIPISISSEKSGLYDLTITSTNNIIYVGGSGEGNYTKIQDAINDANDGDTVFVYNGTYEENLLIDNSIKLIGENKENTIIDGDNKEKWINVIEIKSNNVKISSFTIKGSLNGVYIAGDYTNITNNIILKNNHYGIHSCCSSYHNINNNYISNTLKGINIDVSHHNKINGNTLSNNGNGINLQYSINNTVIDNNFYSDGIRISGDKIKHWNSHIIQNNFANGRPIKYYKNLENVLIQNNATQVILANCTSVRLNDLNTSDVTTGIKLGFSQNCIIQNSTSSNNNNDGITFCNSSNNIIDNNNFSIKLKCLKCNHEWEYKGVKHRTRCPNRKCRKWVKTGLVTPYTLGTHRKKTSQKIDKRKGRQLSIDTIMQREHYRAIIAINHYFDKGEGITRPQYRWVLIKDHDRIEKTSTFKGRKKDFDNFFKHDRFGNKRVLKRILSSDNNLGNFLKHLVDYQILERFEDEKGVERFKLKVDALQLLKHRALHVIIEIFGRIDGIDSLYDLLVNYVREKHNTFFDLSESPLGIKIKIKKGAYRGKV